jgi:hypothetical protein
MPLLQGGELRTVSGVRIARAATPVFDPAFTAGTPLSGCNQQSGTYRQRMRFSVIGNMAGVSSGNLSEADESRPCRHPARGRLFLA